MSDGKRLVITGGIGSGKSAVSGFLAARGWAVLDADRVGHEVLTWPTVIEQVSFSWPEAIVDGRVDRKDLGRVVFANPSELARLEAIVHPEIARRLGEWVESAKGDKALEISVGRLIDASWGAVIVVDAPDSSRLHRSISRGLDAGDAAARLAAQPQRREWLHLAEHVISNTGSLGDLEQATGRLASWMESS